ncbi:MAG: GNAT family N-acetyltransferase [Ignavibacteriales bacterium]|nr:GNAT family N-acetyltransferase [Ignavibacteriales bacterium]
METENQSSKLKIVSARKEDVTIVISFIKQLAEYEKLSNDVTATEELLTKTLFSPGSVAKVLLAYYDDAPAGFAIYFFNFSTFVGKPGLYLEDVFVKPHLRGKGIGKAILVHLAKIAIEKDCGRFEWSVLNWNKPSIEFYKNLGAKPLEEWKVFRLDGKALEKLSKSN